MDFQQYLGFLVFLFIFTAGFWLMIFLVSLIPYWIVGFCLERFGFIKKEDAEPDYNETWVDTGHAK